MGTNLTFVEPTYGCSVTGQNCQELSRPKRFIPLLMFTGIIVLVGLAASSAITAEDVENNQQTFADSYEKQICLPTTLRLWEQPIQFLNLAEVGAPPPATVRKWSKCLTEQNLPDLASPPP